MEATTLKSGIYWGYIGVIVVFFVVEPSKIIFLI